MGTACTLIHSGGNHSDIMCVKNVNTDNFKILIFYKCWMHLLDRLFIIYTRYQRFVTDFRYNKKPYMCDACYKHILLNSNTSIKTHNIFE